MKNVILFTITAMLAFATSAVCQDLSVKGERHLKNIKQLTFGGENAEAYFSFDGKSHQKESALHPTASCNKCHEEDAAEDFVFSQFYPVLTAAAPHSK